MVHKGRSKLTLGCILLIFIRCPFFPLIPKPKSPQTVISQYAYRGVVAATLSQDRRACSVERYAQRLDEQFVVEWFAQEGHCPRRQRPVADSGLVVGCDEDDGQRIAATR